ncbi:MAG: TauD/TfdA family dioxygenase [Novosphingobium sp.]|nr:TauD/TfdA family dioxygenase [Novosphingobium sp.]
MVLKDVKPLREDLPFGVIIRGMTKEQTKDPAIRRQVNELFYKHGMILFEGVEPSSDMQVALSDIFGPLKEHPVYSVARVDREGKPGVVEIAHNPEDTGIVEFGGKQVAHWLPWHMDHAYNGELNRAGVLRPIKISKDGGLTGFCDGVALYKAFPKDLLEELEGKQIIYTLNTLMSEMRFGLPDGFREISEKPGAREMYEASRDQPRALHPAIWTLPSGERCLHVSPWMAEGIYGMENKEGDALLEDVCQTINRVAKSQSYWHKWRPTDMAIWDNCRMLHAVSGHPADQERKVQRTTIKGDYGLGSFEPTEQGEKVLEVAFE